MPSVLGTYANWQTFASGNPQAYLVSVQEVAASGNYIFEYNNPAHLDKYQTRDIVGTEQFINASGGYLS